MTLRWLIVRQLPLWIVATIVYLFLLGPVAIVIILSFGGEQANSFELPPREFSLDLYWQIPSKYFRMFAVSFSVAAVSAILATLIGGAAALGIMRGNLPGKNQLQEYFRLPLQIPFVVTGVVFLQFYNQLFRAIGLDFLGTFVGLVMAFVFVTIPYGVGTISAVLARISPEFEEAAQSLGASGWTTFRRVTFPLMRPGIFAGLSYAFIISFGDVPIALFLVGSDYVTLPVEIFQDMQFDFDPSLFAVSTLVVIFSVALIVGTQRLTGLDLVLPAAKR